jgi:hypothetical protein
MEQDGVKDQIEAIGNVKDEYIQKGVLLIELA